MGSVWSEKFEGTGHVAHVRGGAGGNGNAKKYWGLVEKCWGESQGRKTERVEGI